MQLTIKTFPKQRPNITLLTIRDHIARQVAVERDEPSNKEIRLAIELAKHKSPMALDRNDTVRSILQCNVSDERIYLVKPFKKIIYKKIIVCENGVHKTKKVLRKRNVSK